jgi:hypothetical protein
MISGDTQADNSELISLTFFFKASRLKRYDIYETTEFHTEWLCVCNNITSKFRTTAILKALLNKITIHIQLVGLPMIYFHCTKLHLSK